MKKEWHTPWRSQRKPEEEPSTKIISAGKELPHIPHNMGLAPVPVSVVVLPIAAEWITPSVTALESWCKSISFSFGESLNASSGYWYRHHCCCCVLHSHADECGCRTNTEEEQIGFRGSPRNNQGVDTITGA